MTFVDTNYFLRFILKDNPKQSQEARTLFEKALLRKENLFTSTIVIFEIYWVLSSFYGKKKKAIISTLNNILRMTFIGIEERAVLYEAARLWEKENLSFEDCYNLAYAKSQGAASIKTFDKTLASKLKERGCIFQTSNEASTTDLTS